MNALHSQRPLRRYARPAGFAGVAATLALIVWAVIAAETAARGWQIAFVFWSGIPIGALVLLLIRALTGGIWGEAALPSLVPAALAIPLFGLLFVPVLIGLPLLFPWAADPQAVRPVVSRYYLNLASFAARDLAALFGWAGFAFVILRVTRRPLVAGLGLAFHGLAVSLVAVDWVLAADPRFSSSAFGACLAVQQILSALAWAALFCPRTAPDEAVGELAGLLLATVVGVFYLVIIQYLVIWYSDLPDRVAWYVRRGRDGWEAIVTLAFLFGSLFPFLGLLLRGVRRSAAALRVVGASVLLGVLLHDVWLLGPEFGWTAVAAAPVALLGMGGLWIAVAYGDVLPVRRLVHGA